MINAANRNLSTVSSLRPLIQSYWVFKYLDHKQSSDSNFDKLQLANDDHTFCKQPSSACKDHCLCVDRNRNPETQKQRLFPRRMAKLRHFTLLNLCLFLQRKTLALHRHIRVAVIMNCGEAHFHKIPRSFDNFRFPNISHIV